MLHSYFCVIIIVTFFCFGVGAEVPHGASSPPLGQSAFRLSKKRYSVFAVPGFISWKSCRTNRFLCVSWPAAGTPVVVEEKVKLEIYDEPSHSKRLFYRIKFISYTEKNKVIGGWVPFDVLEAIEPLNSDIERTIASQSSVVTEKEIVEKTKVEALSEFSEKLKDTLIAFEFNRSIQDSDTLWSNTKREKQHDVLSFMNFNVKFHLLTSFGELENKGRSLNSILSGQNDITKDRLSMAYVGFGATAPLFLDVEMGGSYKIGMVRKSETLGMTNIQKLQGHLSFMLPYLIDNTPIKIKAQGNFNLWNETSTSFLSKAYAIVESGPSYEGKRFSFQFLPGIVLNSDGIDLRNHNLLAEFGLRLIPRQGFDSPILGVSFKKFHNSVSVSNVQLKQDLVEWGASLRYDF